jgi:hypothetical protein
MGFQSTLVWKLLKSRVLLFHLDYATEADAVVGLARWSCTARHFASRSRRGI